jgi:hypothetical protein
MSDQFSKSLEVARRKLEETGKALQKSFELLTKEGFHAERKQVAMEEDVTVPRGRCLQLRCLHSLPTPFWKQGGRTLSHIA